MAVQYSHSFSQSSAQVEVRVVDVGAGLCCLIKLPNDKFIIYDAGNGIENVKRQLNEFGLTGKEVELMVLSHTDADHWGVVTDIMESCKVKKLLKTDYRKNKYSGKYTKGLTAIENEPGLILLDLKSLTPNDIIYENNGVKVAFVAGFEKPLAEWGDMDTAEANNSVSIVMKLEYGGHSILFCGDAIGKEPDYQRSSCSNIDECIATEKFMLENGRNILKSDVIIAPHHGADNASCTDFINAVSPKYVIFSCGDMQKYKHPRSVTALRYISTGVKEKNIYRTDYFDIDENKIQGNTIIQECRKEWKHIRNGSHRDNVPDDIRIILKEEGSPSVRYLY